MPTTATESQSTPTRHALTAIVCLLAAIFVTLALASYEIADVSSTGSRSNLVGLAGVQLAYYLVGTLGIVAWTLPLGLGAASGLLLLRREHHQTARRLSGFLLLVLCLPGLCQILPVAPDQHLIATWGLAPTGGGYGGRLGALLCAPEQGLLTSLFSGIGAGLVLTLGCVFAWRLLAIPVVAGVKRFIQALRRAHHHYGERRDAQHRLLPRRQRDSSIAGVQQTAPAPLTASATLSASQPPGRPSSTIASVPPQEVEAVARRLKERESTAELGEAQALVERIRQQRRAAQASEEATAGASRSTRSDTPTPTPVLEPTTQSPPPPPITTFRPLPPDTDDDHADLPDEEEPPTLATRPHAPPATAMRADATDGAYALPQARILDARPSFNNADADAEVERTSRFIEEIFAQYKVNVQVVAATRGPYITQFELELLDAGMRVNKVAGLEQELSLNLGTQGIRIVAPLPNKKTIGVEVPNQLKEPVVMRDLVEEIDPEKYALPLVLGRDVIGRAMVGDLAKMPHLLVAGATGMGKSVCLNAIISSILLFRDPESVKFIMVDPKMVELAPYEDIPHLLTPPITDMSKAHAALEWACQVMDERYYALRLAGVREIKSFNALGEAELIKRLAKKGKDINDLPGLDHSMSYIIIVVDEYADLMMVNKDVEKAIVRLTAKSRACGIHIILTTQRPSADVVTGLIKSNLPSRICFRVADRNNSRVVLDSSGAENLLGKGDMLFLPPGVSDLVRGQGVWVKDHEIDAIIAHTQQQGVPHYDDNIFRVGAAAMAGGGEAGGNNNSGWITDRKFHEAVQAMFRYNKTGADFLRRKLAIGYNKATQYVEWLEDLGFVSESKGTRPRDFLKSWQDWLDELKINDVSWDEDDDIYHDPFA